MNPVRQLCPGAETGSASSYEQPSTVVAWNSVRRSERCGSQKWEPTCSAALRRSTTRSDSSRRSMARSSTKSDGDRQLKRLRNSLTRKRSLVQIQYGPPFSKTCPVVGAKTGADGEPEARGTGLRPAGCPSVTMTTAVVTSVVRCRQLLQCDDPLLMLDGLRALFSQVNNGLRDMFPARADSALLTGQRFMIAWRRYRTPVQLRIASVTPKQSQRGDGCHGNELSSPDSSTCCSQRGCGVWLDPSR